MKYFILFLILFFSSKKCLSSEIAVTNQQEMINVINSVNSGQIKGITILITKSIDITQSFTIPKNTPVRFIFPSKLILKQRARLTIIGNIINSNYNIFNTQNNTYSDLSDDGEVVFGSGYENEINFEWFLSNLEDDDVSINRAFRTGGVNFKSNSNKKYVISKPISIPSNVNVNFNYSKLITARGKFNSFNIINKENINLINIETTQSEWGGNNFYIKKSKKIKIENINSKNFASSGTNNIILISESEKVKVHNVNNNNLKSGNIVQIHNCLVGNIDIYNIKSETIKGNNVRVIYITHSNNITINKVYGKGGKDCIHWYGGEANMKKNNFDGILNVKNIKISDVNALNMRAGVWGTNGKDISVFNCFIENMDDVGLDAEGGENIIFSNFIVKNCANSGLSNFYNAKNIIFSNGLVSIDSINRYNNNIRMNGLVFKSDSGNTIVNNVIFNNKTTSFLTLLKTDGNNENIQISNSKFINGTVLFQESKFIDFSNNFLSIDDTKISNFIETPSIHLRGTSYSNISHNNFVRKNDKTIFNPQLPQGAIVIESIGNSNQSNYNPFNGGINTIKSNKIYGFKTALFDRNFNNIKSLNSFIDNGVDLQSNNPNIGKNYYYNSKTINGVYYKYNGKWIGNYKIDSLTPIEITRL